MTLRCLFYGHERALLQRQPDGVLGHVCPRCLTLLGTTTLDLDTKLAHSLQQQARRLALLRRFNTAASRFRRTA